jgi:hypothetical protein
MMDAEQERVMLRLPAGVRDTLKRAAKSSKRSMNSQTVYYVSQGLRLDGFAVPRPGNESAEQGVGSAPSA